MKHKPVFHAQSARNSASVGPVKARLHLGSQDLVPQAVLRAQVFGSKTVTPTVKIAPFALLLAFLSGGIGWIWAHWLRISLYPVQTPTMALVSDLITAMTMLVLLRLILGLQGRLSVLAQGAGMVLGMVGLPALVHLWPALFAYLFPSQWVASALTSPQPMSVNLGAFLAL